MVPTLLKAGWLDTWEMVFSRFYAMTSFQLLHKAVYNMASLFARFSFEGHFQEKTRSMFQFQLPQQVGLALQAASRPLQASQTIVTLPANRK